MPDGIKLGGAYYELTADDSALIRSLARSQTEAKSFSDAIARAMTGAASSTDQSMKKMAASTQQASAGFAGLTKSVVGFGVGVLGVVTAAEALRATIGKVITETQKAEQAQFALNQLYGAASPIITKFAEAQADALGRSRTDAKEAAASVATLARNYALTGDQIQKVLTISANLAAVRGIGLAEAAERVQSAIRGEAEAIEYLGIAVQSNALKALAQMTDAERKHFETLSDVTKAQIILNAINDQSVDLQGAAAERLKTSAGAADALKASIDNLAVTVGQHVAPAFITWELAIANVITRIDELIKKNAELALAPFTPPVISELDAEIRARTGAPPRPGSPSAQPPGRLPGPGIDPAEIAAMDAQEAANRAAREKRAATERRADKKAELEAADKANDATVESEIRAIDKERKAKERWYDEERQRIEARRTYQLDDIEARKDAALKGIEAEKQAAKDRFDAQIKQAEREKQLRIDTAEAAADAARKAIDAEKQALDHARAGEDRAREDARREEDRAEEDARRSEDRGREDARRSEDRDREHGHKAILDGIEERKQAALDGLDAEAKKADQVRDRAIRGLEREADAARAAHDARTRSLEREADAARSTSERRIRALDGEAEAAKSAAEARTRALDDEADAARDSSEAAIRGIKDRQDAEQERHRLAMQGIEDEEDAQLRAIDAELAALQRQQDADEKARRLSELRAALSEAQQRLGTARETAAGVGGDPKLIAREVQAVADAEEAIRREGTDDEIDAQKARLDAAKDAIRDRLAAQKRAEDEESRRRERQLHDEEQAQQDALKAALDRIDGQKRAEQDGLKANLDRLDGQKRIEQDALKATLDRLASEKQAEDDALARHLKRIEARKQSQQDETATLLDAIKERRKAVEDDAAAAKEQENRRFEDGTTRLQDERRAQDQARADERQERDRFRADEREAQDRARAAERTAQDEALSAQLAAVSATLEAERKAAEEAYTGPNGIITQLRAASEATEREYSRQLAAARAAFEEERKAAERVYTNPDGTGQLDLLAKARQAEIDALEASKADWQAWQKAASAAIKQAMDDLDAFIKRGANVPRIGGDAPAQRSPGSGKLTQSSDQETRSGRSGKSVKGDVSSWLNDAIDITGVSDDWIVGLQRLVQLESGGDPHNQNNEDVIDPTTGQNLGKAKGLLQMLQSTFDANRDKDLPDDIFDPVANAVAAIRYIKKRYGHVDNAVKNHAQRGGYDAGGMISEPVVGWGMRSGRPYAIAERGPEYVVGRSATAAMLGSGLGRGPAGGAMMTAAALHAAGGAARASAGTSLVFNNYGTSAEIAERVMGHIRRRDVLDRLASGRV